MQKSNDENLKELYNDCVESLIQFRSFHVQIVTRLVQLCLYSSVSVGDRLIGQVDRSKGRTIRKVMGGGWWGKTQKKFIPRKKFPGIVQKKFS